MHASSFENMQKCLRRYVEGGPLAGREKVSVLDIGAADVNGSFRRLFDHPRFDYVAADIVDGDNVTVVLEDPNKLPLEDGSVDLVLSGQMLEHCEFFWLTFAEMVRVLKEDGLIFLIAPSAGAIHRYPVDCYRFYPDAYRALAKYAGCHLVDVWVDERGPWCDLVGIFSRQPMEAVRKAPELPLPALSDVTAGTEEEEAVSGGRYYYDVLADLHRLFRPEGYLEIGVRRGGSLALAQCPAVGVDPAPEVTVALPETTQVVRMTSDDFFEQQDAPAPFDMAFIDGMHLFEYVLRDFMNVERLAPPHGLVVIDDVFPCHTAQAERTRRTRVWTGDVWKIAACLERFRPDLVLVPLDCAMTGLLLVSGLDSSNRVLWDRYNQIVRVFVAMEGPPESVLSRSGAFASDEKTVEALASGLVKARSETLGPRQVQRELKALKARLVSAPEQPA